MTTNTLPPSVAALALAKLIAGQSLNGYTSRLPDPWASVARAVMACPPSRDQRVRALDAALSGMPEAEAIKAAIFAADTGGDLESMLAQAEQEAPQEKPRYTLRNAAYALQPQPPIDWIVDKLFSSGSVSLIVGNPGSKKTYAMVSAAVCVALGKPWLGEYQTKRVNALIVDEESGDRRMARRLGEVLRGEFGDESTPIHYISLAQFNLTDPAECILLRALIEEIEAGFVVIDALADIMPGADENAVKDVQPVFLRLRKIAEDTGAAIVLVHHANKAGGYRGSTAMSGAVDLLLMVDSKPESPNVDFSTEKARDIEPFKFAATAHFSDGQVWFTASDPKEQRISNQPTGKAENYVIRYLEDHNGTATIEDIMGNADICSEQSARQAAYGLANKKLIVRSDPGGKGSKATYTINNPTYWKPDPEKAQAAQEQLAKEQAEGVDLGI